MAVRLVPACGLPYRDVLIGQHLIGQDVYLQVVQEILGHTDIRVIQKYTHVSSAAARDTADRVGDALWSEN